MRLHRLRVEQLRQFRQPYEIAGFESGLNLFTGPNEAGKTTLVRALRAAFFERYRSTSVDDLLPWGEPSAAPSVELEFSIGDTDYRLRKSFLHRKRCELMVGTTEFDGEDAEQHLAELFGFRFAGKGASKPEHWGIPGLLWIEQGSAQDIAEPIVNATDLLREALDHSTGEVASTRGDEVINRVRSERETLLTSTGKPRGIYAEAIKEQEDTSRRIVELDKRIAQYRAQVDQLGLLRAAQSTDEAEKPWEALRAQERDAGDRLKNIEQLKVQIEGDLASQRQLHTSLGLVEDQITGFHNQERSLKQREADLQDAMQQVQIAESAEARWSQKRRDAEETYQQASTALGYARQQELRSDLTRRIGDAQSRISALTDAIAKAESELDQLSTLRKLAAESELDEAELDRLRQQHATLQEVRIRQEATATQLHFNLAPTAQISLDGQALAGIGEHLITTAVELDIANVGRLKIIPGSADLAELVRKEAEVSAAHQALLQRLDLPSLAEAQIRYSVHQKALNDIEHSERTLQTLAPTGIEGLRADLAAYTERKRESEEQQAGLDPLPEQVEGSIETSAQADARQQAARVHLNQVEHQAGEAKLRLVTMLASRDAALRERDAQQALVSAPDRTQRLQDAKSELLRLHAESEALQQRTTAKQGQVDASRPDILAQDVERFRRSAEQAEQTHRARQNEVILLQGKLEEAGAQGLEEERAEQCVRADAAQRRYQEIKRRAEALDLLLTLLEAKRMELIKRLQDPLRIHINRYVQILFPQAALDIGEDLIPGRLTRPNQDVAGSSGLVEDLSFGAREQMGVITRLAYADLLQESGRPTLIILDDALVHSDDQRLEQMKRVIFDAAQRHQVLLFTCHPGAWRDLGVAPRFITRSSAAVA